MQWSRLNMDRRSVHKNTPYHALLNELSGVYCNYFEENWPRYDCIYRRKARIHFWTLPFGKWNSRVTTSFQVEYLQFVFVTMSLVFNHLLRVMRKILFCMGPYIIIRDCATYTVVIKQWFDNALNPCVTSTPAKWVLEWHDKRVFLLI